MSTLDRRLTVLEQRVEDRRLRPIRALAQERGIPFERLMELYEEYRTRTAELRAQGYTEAQIMVMMAERLGISPEALRARADELAARFGLDS